jgi:hypothetical protein
MIVFSVHVSMIAPMQQEKTITCLEQTCQEFKEWLVVANIEFEKQTQALNAS